MKVNSIEDWNALYETWQKQQAAYIAAQKDLDDTVTQYLEAKGPPPTREQVETMATLKQQMQLAREALDAAIASHAGEHQKKHNLPRHE